MYRSLALLANPVIRSLPKLTFLNLQEFLMKISKVRVVLATAFIVVLLTGCRLAPVRNVDSAYLIPSDNTSYTLNDVTQAIMRAGIGLGWQMKQAKPGHLIGTLLIRDHRAVIDVTYDKATYSIQYRDSSNLNYTGTEIHQNYNGWIIRLEQAIQSQLSLI
jgi:hypothetical protein